MIFTENIDQIHIIIKFIYKYTNISELIGLFCLFGLIPQYIEPYSCTDVF